ncbi:hypothetical protein QTP88_000094 [Uroleucon formosanum]
MSISQDCLEQVEADPTLLDRVITGDESWYFQYDPETKRQSQQWLSPGAARPKKARMSKSNLRSSSNEYVCDQSRPCSSNEQYVDTNDTLVISGMSNDVCDSALVEKTVINADKNETHNNKCIYYRYIGDFLEEDLETPRRRKLFWNTHTKMLDEKNQKKRLLEQKNRRLESKISSLNTLVDELKKECQLNASYSHILKNIGTEEEKQLLMRQLQISTGKSICPILRKFAMTLHFYSPSAYSYVRTIFSKALPDVSTIRKWYSKLDGLPGMTKESFQAISLKVKEMKGYIDFGLGGKTEEMDNLPYAKDAFVIMVVDINTSWKVPIAYYLINGISAEEKANIILNCLQELDTTGVIIKTLTFDGAANNFSMASELEANLQYSELKPYFLHPNTNDKKLPWRLEDINESGLHSATKLRNRHIYYFREKMKVRLAVQTFSTSVANAILFCMNDLKLDNFQGADATIEFCLSINNIFDILNTRNFLSKGTYNKSINKRTKTEIFHYIEESIDYLAGGFNALKNQQNVDHIEMLFSAIRAKGGFNNNPTVSQFEAAYKSIIVHSEIKSSSSANCMALDDTTILTVSSSNIKVKDTQSELLDLLCVAGTDDLENDNLVSVYQHSNFINDVVACIAGFVSTVDHLKVQTSNPEAYRTLVHYLRNEKAEFHTFQLKEDKPMRIVIRNLHPSTSTEMIRNELEHRLYEVRQVTQVISKIPLPLFFVDLEPTDHSKEIFKLESILHTKIKIEEPHKPKIISQCQNCQAYGHTKAYCGYSPRCVRCGDDHSSSACPNSRQDPMRCAFCTGALYSPPHHNISNATFTDYFNTIKNNFIIGGDYNAKHNAWGCRTNNPRGIVLYNFVNANNFNVLAPPGPTYWPSSPAKNPDILDIFETKIPSNLHCLTKNILELNSDHSSVILNVSATVFARVEPPRLFSPLTDRLEFQNIINQRIDLKIKLKSNYDIDEAVNNLTMLIQSATWEATKPNKTHDSKNNYPIVSDQIRCLIVEKRRARAKYQVTRLPSHKTAYNKLANLLKKVLAKYKSYEFEQNYTLYLSLMGVYGGKLNDYLNIKLLHPTVKC